MVSKHTHIHKEILNGIEIQPSHYDKANKDCQRFVLSSTTRLFVDKQARLFYVVV